MLWRGASEPKWGDFAAETALFCRTLSKQFRTDPRQVVEALNVATATSIRERLFALLCARGRRSHQCDVRSSPDLTPYTSALVSNASELSRVTYQICKCSRF